MVKRKPQKPRALKRGAAPDALRASALALFVEKGYHAVGIRELSKAVGLTEAALYRHWSGKQALAVDLFQNHLAEVCELFAEAWPVQAAPEAGVAATTAAICRLYDERPLVFRFVLMMQHELANLVDPSTRMPMDLLIERLEAAKQRRQCGGDPRLISAAIIGIFLQTATYVLYGRLDGPLSRHERTIARHAMAVIAS